MMNKPEVGRKPQNIAAQIGLAMMSVFLGFNFFTDIQYYFDLKDANVPIPFRLIGDIIFVAFFFLIVVYTWILSFSNPVLWEEKRRLAVIVAILYLIYYFYFIGEKLEARWDRVSFGVFTLAMYLAIIPDALLWWDIYHMKTRSDKYFAYLFALKQLSLYEQKKLSSINQKEDEEEKHEQ